MPAIAFAIGFSFFINLLMFVSPLYMMQIYDRVLASRSETTLISLTILAALLLAVYGILEALRSRILVRAGLIFDQQVATPVFKAVHRGNLNNPSAGFGQALRDVDTIREFFGGAGLITLCDLPWTPVFVFAAFLLHPWLGFIALGGAITTLILTVLNELLTKPALTRATGESIRANDRAQAALRNTEVVQAMGMTPALAGIWSKQHQSVLAWQSVASDRAGALLASTKFFRLLLQTLILGVGAYLAIEREISPGAIIAASIIIGRAMQPVEGAVAHWKGFIAARGALGRVRQLFDTIGEAPERMSLPKPTGRLSVSKIITLAPGRPNVILNGITFELAAGQVMGVIGPSAAGKSSLARVLVGVWPVRSGSVCLDGSELAHWNPEELGLHIGYLPQDVELFAGTVAQNIARFQDYIEADVFHAAALAGCHEMIQALPDGYNTEIGDSGQVLSGGQRQRIGLARAIFGKPSFVVLDEPNASLDTAGEAALLNAVQQLRAQRTTVILITHKMNVLTLCDKILIVNQGAVQAFGDRDEILSKLAGPRAVPATPGGQPTSQYATTA